MKCVGTVNDWNGVDAMFVFYSMESATEGLTLLRDVACSEKGRNNHLGIKELLAFIGYKNDGHFKSVVHSKIMWFAFLFCGIACYSHVVAMS